ncbi:polycystic kidney disease protein 1-like 3 [Varanus komodoensis]|uniref:polycystic kidney disease protein 1-like 3 n=1 Tax=Varanus komodoensis TaxID=61221 RepID=UPI001CF7B7AF|nr:polycystic kidney disease protein 1-like 3 [Varanus komodoensis]
MWHEPSGQGALEELLDRFGRAVGPSAGWRLALERAARDLQRVTSAPARLSSAAQALAAQALLRLSSQLPKEPPAPSNISGLDPSAAAEALFQALGNLLEPRDGSQGQWQGEGALEAALGALPLIQTGLLLGRPSAAADSPVLSTTVSSCPAASLPGRSFHLPRPWPVRVTFPSVTTLVPLLRPHRHLQVQVASFALNPFRHLDGTAVGSVASVSLVASREPLRIQGLAEEIEVGVAPSPRKSGKGVLKHGPLLLPASQSQPSSKAGQQTRRGPRLPGQHLALLGQDGAAPEVRLGGEAGEPAHLSGGATHFSLEAEVPSMGTGQALLLSMRPSVPVQLLLRLGDGPAALLNTTLPRGPRQEEGAYVWVIPAEELRHGVGTFHISAEVAHPPRSSWNLSSSLVSAGCYYWAVRPRAWRSNGCRVGPRSTPGSIQCLCSHLSFFGRVVLVLPHRICLQCTGQLLRRVGQNPAGVALLGSLLLGYGVALLWVRQRQKADAGKVKVTALADNAAGASYLYLVQVFTGHRRGAGTSAKVTLTIYGAEGRSEAHLLRHPEPPCLERGGMDAFLLATWTPLGELHAVRLWHSNTGPSPSWFVRRLVISDLQAGKKWHFLAGRWLAVELGDGQLDGVFVAASERELLSFRHLFWEGLVGKLTQEHLWLSVGSCSPWSPFTRAQRLSCCFALLLCSMLTSIMFWKEPPEDGSRPKPAGPFAVTWQQLVVSAEAAVLLLPVHLLITRLFQLGQLPDSGPPPRRTHDAQPVVPPRQTPLLAHLKQELTETLGFLYKNPLCRCRDMSGFPGTPTRLPELVSGLCGLIHSHLQHLEDSEVPPPEGSCHLLHYLCHVVNDLEAQLRTLGGSSQPDPYDCLHAAGQLRQLWQRLAQQHQAWPCGAEPRSCLRRRDTACLARPRSQTSGTPGQGAAVEPARPSHRCPSRRGLVSWGVLGATCLATAFFTGLYSLQMDKEQAARWAITTLLSVLQNILLLQPLKVLALTTLSALLRRREPWQDGGQEQQLQRQLGLLLERAPGRAPPCSRDCSSPLYRPPALTPSAPWKERAQQEEKLCFLLREIVVQLLFLAVLMVLGYRERGPHEFCLNNALRKVFATKLKDVRTQEQLYSWARQSLLPGVYSDAQGLAMDGNSFLVGSVRLRQIRARGTPWKPVPAVLALQQKHLMGSLEEVAGPAPRWGSPGTDRRTGDSPWEHQSESALKERPIWGKLALYPGSGYLADLGTNTSHANSVLQYLEQNHWLDGSTRAVFVEFVVYNANVNLFCVITLILETDGLGKMDWGDGGGSPSLRGHHRPRIRPDGGEGALLSTAELQILRLYPSSDGLVQLACAHTTFLLFVLYYIVVQPPHGALRGPHGLQGRQVKRQKLRYFGSKGSLLDASVTLISVAAVGLHVKRSLLAHGLLRRHRQDRTRFISFQETVEVDSALTYLIAFLIALATVKLWKLLQLHSRMRLITETLRKGWDKALGLLVALLVLLTGYASGCNLMFGWSIADYKTFFDSGVTIVGLLVGIFNYEEVIALDPVLGSALIVTGVFSMVFVILNLFVSALLTIFSQEMKAAKASIVRGVRPSSTPVKSRTRPFSQGAATSARSPHSQAPPPQCRPARRNP